MKKYFGPAAREQYGLPKGGRPVEDKKGLRYGRLVCLRYLPPAQNKGRSCWECQCDCGKVKAVTAKGLTDGNVTSCGCRKSESATRRHAAAAARRRKSLKDAACLWYTGVWSDRDFFAYLKSEVGVRDEDVQRALKKKARLEQPRPQETRRNFQRRTKLMKERTHEPL